MFRLLMVLIIITVAGCQQGSGRETYRDCMDELDLSHVPYPIMRMRLEMLHEIECQQEMDPGFEVMCDLDLRLECGDVGERYIPSMERCTCMYEAGCFDIGICTPDGINGYYHGG